MSNRKKHPVEYIAYMNARARCKPTYEKAQHYAGRGIEFRFNSFEEFFEELGPRPPGTTLDRIDNDGHYEKGNVRWATWHEQIKNRRSGDFGKRQTSADVIQIDEWLKLGCKPTDIARWAGITRDMVSHINTGRYWGGITGRVFRARGK